MTDDRDPASSDPDTSASDEMEQYLQVYIEESDEELESLVEAILRLEAKSADDEALHKSFRMLHSLKGSSGMLGFEIVGGFAHELEDRFERYRSGQTTLDRDTTTLILECVDFLKAFVERLRTGDMSEGNPQPLLARLRIGAAGRFRTNSRQSPIGTASIQPAPPGNDDVRGNEARRQVSSRAATGRLEGPLDRNPALLSGRHHRLRSPYRRRAQL